MDFKKDFSDLRERLASDLKILNEETDVLQKEEAFLDEIFEKAGFWLESSISLSERIRIFLENAVSLMHSVSEYAVKINGEIIANQDFTRELPRARMALQSLEQNLNILESLMKLLRSRNKKFTAIENSLTKFINEVLPKAKMLVADLNSIIVKMERRSASIMRPKKGILSLKAIEEIFRRTDQDIMLINQELRVCKTEEGKIKEIFGGLGLHSNDIENAIMEQLNLTANSLISVRKSIDSIREKSKKGEIEEKHFFALDHYISSIEKNIEIVQKLASVFDNKYKNYSRSRGSLSVFIGQFLVGLKAILYELKATEGMIKASQKLA